MRDRIVLASAFTTVDDPSFVKLGLNPPIPEVRGRAAFGSADYDTDADAFVRRATLTREFHGREWPGFDLQIYRLAEKAGLARAAPPAGREMLINFRGGPKSFPMVAYHRVLNGEIPPDVFRGKIVLVGATTPTLHDIFPTPFAATSLMAGVEIHAQALETLLRDIPLHRAPRLLVPVLAVIAGALAAWTATALRSLPAFGLVAAALIGYLGATHAAFVWGRLWVEVVPVPLALLATYTGTVAKNFAQEQREKRRLSRFFSPDVVAEIVRHRDDAKLAANRRRMTVLFSDIRGFTSMSEKMPPEEVVAFLREYLTAMTQAVFDHGGTVDKYIGDAIMALYNVPFEAPDHCPYPLGLLGRGEPGRDEHDRAAAVTVCAHRAPPLRAAADLDLAPRVHAAHCTARDRRNPRISDQLRTRRHVEHRQVEAVSAPGTPARGARPPRRCLRAGRRWRA